MLANLRNRKGMVRKLVSSSFHCICTVYTIFVSLFILQCVLHYGYGIFGSKNAFIYAWLYRILAFMYELNVFIYLYLMYFLFAFFELREFFSQKRISVSASIPNRTMYNFHFFFSLDSFAPELATTCLWNTFYRCVFALREFAKGEKMMKDLKLNKFLTFIGNI